MKKIYYVTIMMVLFLFSVIGLNAVDYQFIVHVQGSPSEIEFQIPTGSDWQSFSISNVGELVSIPGSYPANCIFRAESSGFPVFEDTDSIGLLDPENVNHIYLVIDGSEEKPDPDDPNND